MQGGIAMKRILFFLIMGFAIAIVAICKGIARVIHLFPKKRPRVNAACSRKAEA